MWIIDLSFLQESVSIFEEHFIGKTYKIYTCSGNVFLIINEVKNYPHLVGVKSSELQRLRGSQFFFDSIKNNDTSKWTRSMKKVFNRVYPYGQPRGLNEIKILFFPLMPELFIKENYIISVNYDKKLSITNGPFDTEILISDFNEGMNIGMRQRNDGSFGFNSWRVELNEMQIMNMYNAQEIDLIDKIEQYEDGVLKYTKTLHLNHKNYWRLSRLLKSHSSIFLPSIHYEKIRQLSKYADHEFSKAISDVFGLE